MGWEGLKALVDCPLRLPYDRYVSAPDVALVGVEVLLQQHRGHLHHPANRFSVMQSDGNSLKIDAFPEDTTIKLMISSYSYRPYSCLAKVIIR